MTKRILINEEQLKMFILNELKTIDISPSEVNTNPTEKQKEKGNYKKAHISIRGMRISIENPKGSYRKYVDENGNEGKNKMKNHYGYFIATKGKDGDAVDCFLGSNLDSFDTVFVVDQNKKGTKEFDESKVMLGFKDEETAKQAYLNNYSKNWKGFRCITGVSLKTFKKWLYRGRKQRQPFSEYVEIQKEK